MDKTKTPTTPEPTNYEYELFYSGSGWYGSRPSTSNTEVHVVEQFPLPINASIEDALKAAEINGMRLIGLWHDENLLRKQLGLEILKELSDDE